MPTKTGMEFVKEHSALVSAFVLIAFLLLASSVVFLYQQYMFTSETVRLKPVTFKELQGWENDNHVRALTAFQESCTRINKKDPAGNFGVGEFAGTSKDWQEICEQLSLYLFATEAEAKNFFERYFTPYEVWGEDGRSGLFTGYYEPTLRGSFKKSKKYHVPLYQRPVDLIKVDLGKFSEDLKGRYIKGRVDGETMVPYFNRTEIEEGALKGKKQEILWVDSVVDAFFLHIQGSGRVVMDTGEELRIGYAEQNGHDYTAIGRELIARGAVPREEMSMQAIRKWLEENPEEADAVMNINDSYVFFRLLDPELGGPLGAEGIPLTPRRSIAVDRKKIPYGIPVWLDAEEPEGGERLRQLMVAQDTGGAIRGVVRGDFFWGAGEEAAHKAGLMKSKGSMWLLLPKSVEVPEERLL